MFIKEKPMSLRGSTSALCNNLSIDANFEHNSITYAVVHKSVVNLVSSSIDGSTVTHKQITCKEASATQSNSLGIILQAKLLKMLNRTLVVIASEKGIQMYEGDGSVMLFWYALGASDNTEYHNFGRGICSVESDTICVGTSDGIILVFNVPPRGTNITLSETIKAHKASIWDLSSSANLMASSDDDGLINIWQSQEKFIKLCRISGYGSPCSSVGIWEDFVLAGYGSGHIRVFKIDTGKILAEVAAHARWINSISIADANGMVLSASEDTFFKLWKLNNQSNTVIEFIGEECVTDLQLQGAQFITDDAQALAITGYDSNELLFYRIKHS